MEPSRLNTYQASAASTRREPSEAPRLLAAPHRSRTAAAALFLAVATKTLQPTGPATCRGGSPVSAFRHPRPQHRFIHHAGIDALQPIIPPAQDFLEESDLGPGKCKVRIGVCPWPDETLAGHLQLLEQARDCILITIGPATDRIDRALDRCVVLAYRSVLPIRIASLVLEANCPGTAVCSASALTTSLASYRRPAPDRAEGTSS